MKKLLTLLLLTILFISCTKEYSSTPLKEEIKVNITGSKYPTIVNGSKDTCWKILITTSKAVDREIVILYQFDDSKTKGMTMPHPINKGSTANEASTQYSAKGSLTNIKIVKVDGANEYKFILQ